MSWKDDIENIKFSITTGDGKTFEPYWKNGEKSREYNISKYDFINLDNSFIDRKKQQSASYPITFWFQGENHIKEATDFETSSTDNRPWVINHPIYGKIFGQPKNLKRLDLNYNITEMVVDFWESLSEDFPENEISFKDSVRDKVESINLTGIDLISSSNVSTSDIPTLKESIIFTENKFSPDQDSYNDYRNIYNNALSSVNNMASEPKISFTEVQKLITYPATFNTPVIDRINSSIEAYYVLKESVNSVFSKTNFESQGATLISSICLSCFNPLSSDYNTREEIENINNLLLNVYDNYLKYLDTITVPISDIKNKWSPSIDVQLEVNSLVKATLNNLFIAAFDSKQERSIILKENSNVILLVHKYIGLDFEDSNIDNFIKINNIKGDEIFNINKGREIKYFL